MIAVYTHSMQFPNESWRILAYLALFPAVISNAKCSGLAAFQKNPPRLEAEWAAAKRGVRSETPVMIA